MAKTKVLVVEDGPTLTHGEMPYGAGVVAARQCGADDRVDPRATAVGSIRTTFQKYPHIDRILPAEPHLGRPANELLPQCPRPRR